MPANRTSYEAALNVISHIVLTKPEAAARLLERHGVRFKSKPGQKQLSDRMIDLISEGQPGVIKDLEDLLAAHLKYKGEELLGRNEDQFLSQAVGVASGLVKGLGGLFGKKKRRKQRARAQQQAMAQRAKSDAAEKMKLMQMQMEAKKQQQQAERQREEDRRRREEKDKDRKAANQRMMLIGGGGVVLALVLVFALKK